MNDNTSVNFIDIGRVIWEYRRYFFLTAILSGILGIVIAFLLPVYYQSTATIYPAAISYVESTDLVYRQGNINELGSTEQAEQILEMFSSQDFKNKIIRETNLFEHYKIRPDEPSAWFKIYEKYRKHIQAERSRYNAVKISVEDRDPQKAAEIVNLIIEELDAFRHEIISRRIRSHYQTLQSSRDSLQQVMVMWSDSLFNLQERGVVSQEERAALLESLGNIRGNDEEIQKRLQANIQYGAQYNIVARNVEFLQNQINTMDKIRLQLQANLSPEASQQFVFETGHVLDKKHSPKRLFVVLGAIGLCLLVLLFYLFLRINGPVLLQRLEL